MLIRELYAEALNHEYTSLILLIEFLVYEKKTITLADDQCALDLYFKENNRDRMNDLLMQYSENCT